MPSRRQGTEMRKHPWQDAVKLAGKSPLGKEDGLSGRKSNNFGCGDL